MFWPIESSSGQIQNIVQFTPDVFNKKQNIELVHSVSAHNKGTHNVYKIILTLSCLILFLQMALQPGVGLGLLYDMPPGLSIPCSSSPFVLILIANLFKINI